MSRETWMNGGGFGLDRDESMMLLPLLAIAGWELLWYERRRIMRARAYQEARSLADALSLPLVVIGAPDLGLTDGPGCGDLVLDIEPSNCPNSLQVDICKGIPLADNSCVVFVCYVLEYVTDADKAISEIRRVGGKNVFFLGVEPWTLAAIFYPGTQRIGVPWP